GASLSFVIPPGAASGPLSLSAGGLSATSVVSLSVVARSSFTLTAEPAMATAIPGKSTPYTVNLNSRDGFGQLATLSVSGLPSGANAAFSPVRISAGQSSILTVTVPANQGVGTSALTVSASATVDGIPLAQSASLSLVIGTSTTGLIGRTVNSDTRET